MAPIHHHFEQLGCSEPTVVIRFWIISIVLALAGLSPLKPRLSSVPPLQERNIPFLVWSAPAWPRSRLWQTAAPMVSLGTTGKMHVVIREDGGEKRLRQPL